MSDVIEDNVSWKPEDIVKPEDFNQDEKEAQAHSPRKVLNFLAAAIFSLFIGVYAGLRSREIFECVVYCLMFASEAVLAEAVSRVLVSYNMQQALHRFALLFSLTATCSVVCGILKRIFGPKY